MDLDEQLSSRLSSLSPTQTVFFDESDVPVGSISPDSSVADVSSTDYTLPQPPTTSSPEVDGLDDNEDNDDAYIKGKNFNLDSSEVYGIFLNAKKQPEKLNTMPPVKPAGGSIFVYDLGSCTAQHDAKKKQLRYVHVESMTFSKSLLNESMQIVQNKVLITLSFCYYNK